MAELNHHGVKGMHWGVRQKVTPTIRSSSKQIAKAQQTWEKSAGSQKNFLKIHNAAASRMNAKEIPRINNKFKGADLTNPAKAAINKQYVKEYHDTMARVMTEEAHKVLGPAPNGKSTLQYVPHVDSFGNNTGNFSAVLVTPTVKHDAVTDGVEVPFKYELDSTGHIISVSFSTALIQTALGEEFLEHHGIKGMHWGVRRSRAADGKVRGPSRSTRDGISSDAARAKDIHSKVKSHGTDVVSNQDLQHLVNRINLEQRYSALTSGHSKVAKVKRGQSAIREIIGVANMAKQVHEIANSNMVKDIKKAVDKTKKGG